MAGSIKLFQYLQSRHQAVGIYPPGPNQHSGSFNSKNSIFIFFFAQGWIASFAFFLFEAKSAYDYGFSFYVIITELATLAYYSITILKMPDILTLIEKYEELIEKSEWKRNIFISNVNNFNSKTIWFIPIGMHDSDLTTMYTQLNHNIERGSEIFHFICARITLACDVLPHLLLTIGNYFVYDLGDESYVLPFPLM